MAHVYCCPKCGDVSLSSTDGEIKACKICNSLLNSTSAEIDLISYFFESDPSYQPGAWDAIVKDAREQYCLHSPQFDQAAWDAREAKEQRDADIASGKVKLPPAPPAPKPKPRCPTCGSENVERLNFVDRGVSFLLVGFASSKVGKSFKCRDCKYTW